MYSCHEVVSGQLQTSALLTFGKDHQYSMKYEVLHKTIIPFLQGNYAPYSIHIRGTQATLSLLKITEDFG